MEFTVVGDHIECLSDSGSTYKLTKDSCSCKGYSFRKKCSHMDQAKKLDVFQQLERTKFQSVQLTRSSTMVEARKDALRQFLKKHGVEFTENKIELFEPKLTSSMTPKLVLDFFGAKTHLGHNQ